MMSPAIDRIERFETILRALTDDTCAFMAAALGRAVLQGGSGPFAQHVNTNTTEPPIIVPWEDLELQLGMPREYLATDLFQADQSATMGLGFTLTQSLYRATESDIDLTQIVLSDDFSSVLNGSVAPRPWKTDETINQPSDRLCPDAGTREAITLVRAVAGTGGGFFYRQLETEARSQQTETATLADYLAAGQNEPQVFVVADLSLIWRRLKLFPSLLSAILHLPERAIILSPFDGQFAAEGPTFGGQADDDELPGPVFEKPLTLARDADKIVSLLPYLSQCVLVTIPAKGTLHQNYLSGFVGAIGPFRSDHCDAIEAIKTSADGPKLSDHAAQNLFDIFGGLHKAKTLLAAADRLIQADETRGKDLDRLISTLCASLGSIVSVGAPAGLVRRQDLFDPDLTICEPDLSPYLARADHLRKAGAKFLLAGEPGTGKTAAAAMIADKLGFKIKMIGGSEVFGRAWGATERLLKKAFQDAAAEQVIMFIDEADALLADRSRQESGRNLVVTATSEFLKHIASHPLPIIAATNFLEDIDKAIIRRFDFVVHTKPLPEDREILAWQRVLDLDPPLHFHPLGNTVVADYALTRRRMELMGNNDPEFALCVLHEVRAARRGIEKTAYGFT